MSVTRLTLRISAADLAVLRQHPLLTDCRIEPPYTQGQRYCYWDTPARLLMRQGIHLYLHQQGIDTWQGLTLTPEQAARYQILCEQKVLLKGHQLDLAAFEVLPKELKSILELMEPRLELVGEAHIQREYQLLQFRNGTQAILCIDIGYLQVGVEAGRRTESIHELGVVLHKGKLKKLLDGVTRLAADIPMFLEGQTLAQRCFRLQDQSAAEPLKATLPELQQPLAGPRLATTLEACQQTLLTNLQVLRAGRGLDNPEWVHQARVALRRIRTLLRLSHQLMPRRSQKLREALCPLAQKLGQWRDWDVFLQHTWPQWIAQVGAHPADALLQEFFQARRYQAIQEVQTELNQASCGRALLELEGLRVRLPAHDRLSARDMACTALRAGYRTWVTALQQIPAHPDPKTYHDLRIVLKKLRYTLDGCVDLFEGKKPKRWLKALTQAQEVLGQQNDQWQAIQVLRNLSIVRTGCAASLLQVEERRLILIDRAEEELTQAELLIEPSLKALQELPIFWKRSS
ncbi:CHAD domain-containing protein [Azomonas agilis]|uniref:CHAD domain-containing protein n=1 Tax=Azomonas agilis TaxID=116849 RepID=A0A562J3B5_9GAMM|nr:CHAD domain-containing protein [Azomonas agilis]TWH77315.1 CHAD domain-containing protein [Azomonas agilis]